MDQENKFGEYWKKIMEFWQAFLIQCGVFWDKAKVFLNHVSNNLRRHGKSLAQKAAVYTLKAREWAQKAWHTLRREGKRLLQKLAAWLLQVREKAQPLIERTGEWGAAIMARFPVSKGDEPAALPAAETAQELPAPAEPAAEPAEEAPAAVIAEVETPAEPAQSVAVEPDEPVQSADPAAEKTNGTFAAVGRGLKCAVKWIWKLRKVIMAIPVIWTAVKLAVQNMDRLPESVGLDIQSTGEFARMITRTEAVCWPLGITMFCLLLMFCSKKPLLPWVISIFTLVLPWLIWILNYYA